MVFNDRQIKELIKANNLMTAEDVQNMLKNMFGKTLEQMLQAELENELGYSKYSHQDKKNDNKRNGYSNKTVRSVGKQDGIILIIFFYFSLYFYHFSVLSDSLCVLCGFL